MLVSELQQASKKRISWYFWEILDLGSVCPTEIFDEDDECPREVDAKGLVRDIEEHFESIVERSKNAEENCSLE